MLKGHVYVVFHFYCPTALVYQRDFKLICFISTFVSGMRQKLTVDKVLYKNISTSIHLVFLSNLSCLSLFPEAKFFTE